MSDQPEKVLCILGMHRSGTSCLTGSLQRAGLYVGKFHTWNHHNHRGNRENPDCVALHEQILADNGGAWDNPPEQVTWSEQHLNKGRAIMRLYAGEPLWGFKDPRTLLCLQGWQQLTRNIDYIGIYRHPIAVIESLNKRGGFSRELGMQLWIDYNSRMLEQYKKTPFPIVSFDWNEEEFHVHLEDAIQRWGLGRIPVEERFFTPKLRTNDRFSSREIPAAAANLYNQLQEITHIKP